MRQVIVYRYQLPVQAQAVLRHSAVPMRRGLLVQLRENDKTGWGEIAPLTGFSRETLAQAEEETLLYLSAWGHGADTLPIQLPSVAFGVSCALAELAGILPADGEHRLVPLLTAMTSTNLAACQTTSGIVKIKVGGDDPVKEGEWIGRLLHQNPSLKVRLDANRNWHYQQVMAFAAALSRHLYPRIEFFEEPCQSVDASLLFSQQTGIALAWDESLRQEGEPLLQQHKVAAVVIKPTLTGSLTTCTRLIDIARQHGAAAVISSSLESSLGLTQLARLAHWLTPDRAPGLDTLSLMPQQLIRCWPGATQPLLTDEQLEIVWSG